MPGDNKQIDRFLHVRDICVNKNNGLYLKPIVLQGVYSTTSLLKSTTVEMSLHFQTVCEPCWSIGRVFWQLMNDKKVTLRMMYLRRENTGEQTAPRACYV